ncbi:MAG: hypothetical protein J6S04_02970 [Clostridia bacterium]|nr:hypothetical protein [Clostridia bacterium]
MDAKITKERLSRMLSYDWLKIVGAAVAAILVWSLVFTVSATRITPAQQFTAINYFGNVGAMNTKFSETMNSAYNNGVFSYEVIELTEVDVGGNAEYGSTLMETRVATSEGDVVFVPNIINEEISYELNGEKVYDTYVQTLVRHYGYALMNLNPEKEDGFFKSMERYVNHYYDGDYKNGTLDETVVRKDFLARIEKNKDKRFKKSADIEKGVKDEVVRIQKYRDALVEFYGYIDSGLVQFETTTVLDYETYAKDGTMFYNDIYTINLCPNSDTMPKLKDVVAYMQTVESEEGETQNLLCADNMHVALMKFDDVEEGFQYESLLYVNYVIRVSKA